MLTVITIFFFLYIVLTIGVIGYRIGFERGQKIEFERYERLLAVMKEAQECSRLADECAALADRAAEVNFSPEVFEKLRAADPKAPEVAYPEDDDL